MALALRMPENQYIHHSDRGAQYTSDDFRNRECRHRYIGNISAADSKEKKQGLFTSLLYSGKKPDSGQTFDDYTNQLCRLVNYQPSRVEAW